MEDIEIWKDCEGDLKNRYEVSDKGRIRNKQTGRFLNSWKTARLQRLTLRTDNGYIHVYMRKLVAQAFIPNPNGYHFVKCKDGNCLNVRADNLYWAKQPKELSTETKERIKRSNNRRLLGRVGCDAMASKPIICVETSTVYFTAIEASEATGVSQQAIQQAVDKANRTAAGYHWKHIKIYKKG